MGTLCLATLWLLSHLPMVCLQKIGFYLGKLIYALDRSNRRTAILNIRYCFPELSPDEQNRLLKMNYHSLGIAILESAVAWWAPSSRLENLLEIEGLEHVTAVQKQGRGIIGICPHFMTLELVGRLCAQIIPLGITYRQHKKKWMENILYRARSKHFSLLIESRKTRSILRALQEKTCLFYAGDVDVGHKGLFVPFFNNLASTSTAPLRYARLSHSAVFMAFFYRRPGGKYCLQIVPIADTFPTGDDEADLNKINGLIEQAIRAHPEQYIWQYRRFKTQIDDGLSIYDR